VADALRIRIKLDLQEDDMMVRGTGARRAWAGGLQVERHSREIRRRRRCDNVQKRKGGSTASGQGILPKLLADVMRLGGSVDLFVDGRGGHQWCP
jgi:hypothetical protein